MLWRYLLSRKKNGRPFRSSVSFPCTCAPNVPVEGILKIVLAGGGMIGEIATAMEDGKFYHYGNAQHATMFFFFGLSGAIDILVFYYGSALPNNLDYVTGAMAFAMEFLLFYQHLHGRHPMDIQVHVLLYYTAFACFAGTVLEMKYQNNILAALSRAYFTLLQGTWFWHVGFVLYNPIPNAVPWDQDSHKEMLLITMIYTWHCAFMFLFILALYAAMNYFMRKTQWDYDVEYSPAPLRNDQMKLLGDGLLVGEDQDDTTNI